MASPISWPSGLGGTGFSLATATNDYFSGTVFWVDTTRGNNANTGNDRVLPLATIKYAVNTAASAGDLIVVEAGSTESLATASVPTLNKAGITILGLGTGANRPRYTCADTIDMFSITAAGVRLYNLYFPASTAAATSRVKTAAAETEINGCYFECGASDTGAAMLVAASGNNCRVINTSAVVTASRPAIGLSVTGAVTDLYVKNLVLDGGSYGWTDQAGKISAAATRILIDGISLINDSNFSITITGTSYKVFGVNSTGSGRVIYAA